MSEEINKDKEIITEIKEERRKAKRILEVLKPLVDNGEMTKNIFENILSDIEDSYDEIQKGKSQNTKLRNEIKDERDRLQGDINEAKGYIKTAKDIESELKTTQREIERKEGVIERRHEYIDEKKQEVTSMKDKVSKLLSKVETRFEKVDKYTDKVKETKDKSEDFLNSISKYKNKAEQNHDKIVTFFEDGKEKLTKIKEQKEEIDGIHEDSEKKYSKIKKWFEYVFKKDDGAKERIDRIEKKMQAQQQRIEEQLNIAASNRLSVSFDNKVKKLRDNVYFWKIITIGLVFAVVATNTFLILLPSINPDLIPLSLFGSEMPKIDWISHISIISPIVFLLVFASLEYVKNKRLLEEYNFKLVASIAMPAYFELIESKDEDKAIEYLEKTTNNIYENPVDKIFGDEKSKNNVLDYISDILKDVLGKNQEKKVLEKLKQKIEKS